MQRKRDDELVPAASTAGTSRARHSFFVAEVHQLFEASEAGRICMIL